MAGLWAAMIRLLSLLAAGIIGWKLARVCDELGRAMSV